MSVNSVNGKDIEDRVYWINKVKKKEETMKGDKLPEFDDRAEEVLGYNNMYNMQDELFRK